MEGRPAGNERGEEDENEGGEMRWREGGEEKKMERGHKSIGGCGKREIDRVGWSRKSNLGGGMGRVDDLCATAT